VVWQKYGTGQAARNAAGYVNDADAETAGKFLQISHNKELEHNCDNELQQPAMCSHVCSHAIMYMGCHTFGLTAKYICPQQAEMFIRGCRHEFHIFDYIFANRH